MEVDSVYSLRQIGRTLQGFWEDEEGGERDALSTLLILALITIPLILVIIVFGNEILAYAQDKWDEVMGSGVSG